MTTTNALALASTSHLSPRGAQCQSGGHGSPGTTLATLLALAAAPAAAADNAIVIDFHQGRLILGWIGLWAIAAAAFMVCTDKRMDPLARLARWIDARRALRASRDADQHVLESGQDDPRIMADIRAALLRSESPDSDLFKVEAAPMQMSAPTTARRSFVTHPLPGLPTHTQYLPG